MKDFLLEVKKTSTSDLLLILKDQKELYSEEELVIIQNEINSRPSNSMDKEKNESWDKSEEEELKREENEINKILNFLMTSGYNFEGYEITKYHRVICAESVMGSGFWRQIKANWADTFGVEAKGLSDKLEEGRWIVTEELVKKAKNLGANAIIGIDFDYTMFGDSLSAIIINGTAVSVKKIGGK
jgi:Uncharacterized conserved protein